MLDTEIRGDWMLHIEPPKNRGRSAGDSYHMAVNAWLRIFLYGLHGFFDEIVFTSLFNFVESNFRDWKFRGHSSLWSFFQYGFGSFVVEQMTVFDLEGQVVLADAFSRCSVRHLGVSVGVQLGCSA